MLLTGSSLGMLQIEVGHTARAVLNAVVRSPTLCTVLRATAVWIEVWSQRFCLLRNNTHSVVDVPRGVG
jgi:hypothetical protein